jgi:hypothetical protein
MGILDRLFGQERPSSPKDVQRTPEASPDEQALERYRYLVRTAPPEAIEQAHREAFEKLTPEQRQQVLRELNATAPADERVADPARADPQGLARMATRAELRQPGTMERTLGGPGLGGPGLGGMFASSLLGSVVGSVIGSAIAHQLLGGFGHSPGVGAESGSDATADQGDESASNEADADEADTSGGSDSDGFGDDLGGGLGDDV